MKKKNRRVRRKAMNIRAWRRGRTKCWVRREKKEMITVQKGGSNQEQKGGRKFRNEGT